MTMTTDEIIEKIKPVNEKLYKELRLKNLYGDCEYLSKYHFYLGSQILVEISKRNNTSAEYEKDIERECEIAFDKFYKAVKLYEDGYEKGFYTDD